MDTVTHRAMVDRVRNILITRWDGRISRRSKRSERSKRRTHTAGLQQRSARIERCRRSTVHRSAAHAVDTTGARAASIEHVLCIMRPTN